MDRIEMIEKLREKADVTYDEAKGILESLDWNMLDALIALEKEGKIKEEKDMTYTTRREAPEDYSIPAEEKGKVKESAKKFFRWCKNIIIKGFDNKLCITDTKGKTFEIQLTVFGLFALIAFELVIIALVIAFFCGCTFRLEGPDLGSEKVNSVMEKIHFSGKDKDENDKYSVKEEKE